MAYVAQQLGRYHLLDRVAFGGMAEIYRAKTFDSQGNQHIVAIKRVLSHLAEDDDFLQMLVDEAKISTLLDHANIARVYEFARWGDEYFIAMEYIDGKDLRSLLDRCLSKGLWIPVEDCVYVMIRVLDALHAAHEKCDGTGGALHIVHRDVSPSNVIVSYQGQVKLCDFGIAKAKMSRVQTRTGVIKGKVRYMSPEQALGRKLDRRTDIFSAGSVLYELLTKQPPFQAENEMELIFRVRDAKFVNPTKYNPNIPTPVERQMRKALAKSRSSRYQTAAEFADDLRDYLQQQHPDYRPKRLGRLLRELFAKEIDKELRLLEEFVVGEANPEALGDNLLAEVLGEGAAYTQFTPIAPSELEEERTRLIPRVPAPESRLPQTVDLHDLKTAIIDPEERDKGVLKRRGRPRPGAHHHRDSRRPTQQQTVAVAPDDHLDLHAASTQIIERAAVTIPPPGAERQTIDKREAAGEIGGMTGPPYPRRAAKPVYEPTKEPGYEPTKEPVYDSPEEPTHERDDRNLRSTVTTGRVSVASQPLQQVASDAGTMIADAPNFDRTDANEHEDEATRADGPLNSKTTDIEMRGDELEEEGGLGGLREGGLREGGLREDEMSLFEIPSEELELVEGDDDDYYEPNEQLEDEPPDRAEAEQTVNMRRRRDE